MKFIEVTYEASIRVIFTERELNLMMTLSARHYDAYCRMVGVPGARRDAFLYGMRNRAYGVARATGSVSYDLTFRQLDTLAKILETPHDAVRAEVEALRATIVGALGVLNAYRKDSEPLAQPEDADPERGRCSELMSANLDSRTPRCGLPTGHDGDHTILIPTGVSWDRGRS